MVLCDICKTPFRCINGEYICMEGHISNTKVEIADDLHFSLRSQKQKIKKEPTIHSKYSLTYKNLLLYNMLYKELCIFLKCNNNFIDFYTNFFTGNRDIVNCPIKISLGYLIVLGYLQKRSELEKQNQVYFYKTYLLEIQNFDYINKTQHIKNLLDMKKIKNKKLGIGRDKIAFINKNKYISILGESKYPINKEHRKILLETSLSHPLIEYNKAVIRQEFDHSLEILFRYFYKVIDLYGIKTSNIKSDEKSNDLVFYFKKYIKLRNLQTKLFVPEDEISYYLYLYNERYKLEIDYKTALKNINLFIGNTKYNPEEEFDIKKVCFVDLIALLTNSSHRHFYNGLESVIRKKEFRGTNNIFVIHKNKNELYRVLKWKSFRIYIKRLKDLLSNKINYKIKRKLIEDDRI